MKIIVEKNPKSQGSGENGKNRKVEENCENEINTGVRLIQTSAFDILMDPKISKSSKWRPKKLKN